MGERPPSEGQSRGDQADSQAVPQDSVVSHRRAPDSWLVCPRWRSGDAGTWDTPTTTATCRSFLTILICSAHPLCYPADSDATHRATGAGKVVTPCRLTCRDGLQCDLERCSVFAIACWELLSAPAWLRRDTIDCSSAAVCLHRALQVHATDTARSAQPTFLSR